MLNILKISKITESVIAGLTRNPLVYQRTLKQVQHDGKILLLALVIGFTSCGDWLDVVPDGVPTIDMAFNSREQALKYLATCYSYLGWTESGNINNDPSNLGEEVWTDLTYITNYRLSPNGIYHAQGMKSATNPLFGRWSDMYQALRDCNIFLDNAGSVPDVLAWERNQWMAEVKVLKAWYHFYLVRQYGPVPLIRENLPVDVNVSTVKVVREPVDDCFEYIVQLIDEATAGEQLPMQVLDVAAELGRITKPIALAVKAKVLVTAASPLFNGNEQQAALENKDGTPLFNATHDPTKWEKAVIACREAITACHEVNIALYEYPNTGFGRVTDTIATQLSLRNAITLRWNSDVIWANTKSIIGADRYNGSGLQATSPRFVFTNTGPPLDQHFGVPLKNTALFYTEHGVPFNEDNTRYINDQYNLRTAIAADKLYVRLGSTTMDMHFDREPRFYAWIGFDCGIWYGNGRTDDKEELYTLNSKANEADYHIMGATGIFPKKWIPYTNVVYATSYSFISYPWPIMRLSDLYLLYAEAINEADDTQAARVEAMTYIDEVRNRAGLKGVEESWTRYSRNPTKFQQQAGLRDIIRQERMIELIMEGHRFWDVRRWKTAPNWYSTPIAGWNVFESAVGLYYTPRVLFSPKFGIRDYFWPISNNDLIINPNLVQNIGW